MASKLRRIEETPLRISYEAWRSGRNAPHLRYANLAFGGPGVPHGARPLLRWLNLVWPSAWKEERTLRFLKKHQAAFRRCLAWLSEGARENFGASNGTTDESWESDLRDKWQRKGEVRFLQQHGLDHAGMLVEPALQVGAHFLGLELTQRKPRDPLDPICWYMLSMLMWHGTLYLRRCRYPRCGKFFQPRTARKRFCSNACRASDFMDKKTPEEKRELMRRWRANPMRRRHILGAGRSEKT